MPGGGNVEEINKILSSSMNHSTESKDPKVEESKNVSQKVTTDIGDERRQVKKFVKELLKEQPIQEEVKEDIMLSSKRMDQSTDRALISGEYSFLNKTNSLLIPERSKIKKKKKNRNEDTDIQ